MGRKLNPPAMSVRKPTGPSGIFVPCTLKLRLLSTPFSSSNPPPKPFSFIIGRLMFSEPAMVFLEAEYFASRSLILMNLTASISCSFSSNPSSFVPSSDSVGSATVSDCGLPLRVKIPASSTVRSIEPSPSGSSITGVSMLPTGERPPSALPMVFEPK